MKKFIAIITLLFLLLFFHNETILGTRSGLLLWYQTLIPSLLPFILVTNALAETNAYQSAARFFQKYFPYRIYEIMAIFLGNLCGYPLGGKILNDFVKNQYLTQEKANRLLALSSQASPMFLIGYIHLHILQEKIPLPVFLAAIYLPVLIYYPFSTSKSETYTNNHTLSPSGKFCIVDTFLHATQIMVMIGMYVIIFSIILVILLPFCKHPLLQLPLSFLEITTGLKLLDTIYFPLEIKLSLLCALSAFGGLCSAFQVKGVLEYPDDSIKKYLLDKLLLSTGTFFIILLYLKLLQCS